MGLDVWDGKTAKPRRPISEATWRNPVKWNHQAAVDGVHRKVFCASMADVFEDHPVAAASRERLFPLIEMTPHLDWQLLTKRPENVMQYVPLSWQMRGLPGNVWMGTSVENQHWADVRIPILLQIPAKVRFLSCEPLLGPLDLSDWLDIYKPIEAYRAGTQDQIPWSRQSSFHVNRLHWVIAGGESGSKHRVMQSAWAYNLRDQCLTGNVPFFFKQWGGRTAKSGGDLLDGQQYHQFPS